MNSSNELLNSALAELSKTLTAELVVIPGLYCRRIGIVAPKAIRERNLRDWQRKAEYRRNRTINPIKLAFRRGEEAA